MHLTHRITHLFGISALLLLTACAPVMDDNIKESPDPASSPTTESETGKLSTPTSEAFGDSDVEDSVSLDAIWEEMPLPATPEPPPIPVVPTADPDQPVQYFPTSESEGRYLPTPDAVWRAGHLNGLPKDVEAPYPASEYAEERNFAKAVHIRDPNELPAFLETGQALVIHLPTLPPDLYVLQVATSGGTEEEGDDPGFYSKESYRRRFLRLRFNDQIIWQRTVPPFHAITKAVLDPNRLHPDGNLITLENVSTHPIPLDAVWITAHRPEDRPMFIALDQGEWLNREHAGWVRTLVVHVNGSQPIVADDVPGLSTQVPDLPAETLRPVRSAEELPDVWNRVQLRFRLLEKLGHPDLDTLRAWAIPLREAVNRGAFPILQLDSAPDSPTVMEAAAYVFGELVSTWILPRSGDAPSWEEILKSRIPTVGILTSRFSAPAPGILGLQARQFWMGFELSVAGGRNRARYFRGSLSRDRLPSKRNVALSARFSWLEAYKPIWPGSRSSWATNSVAEWLMRRETPVILQGGYPGGPFFPDGSDRAGDLWWWMKPLTRFGSPHHRPGVANIIPSGPDTNPVFLHWGVADNGIDSVQVLVHTPSAKANVEGMLELPVPWSGPTRMVHHATTRNWARVPKEERDMYHIDLEAVELQAPGESGARGWIQHTFRMRGMHVFELYPAELADRRRIQAPEAVGFARLMDTRNLFNPGKEPPPSWWSRKEMGEKFSYNWRPSGSVNLQVEVAATLDGAPGWEALKGFHALQPKTFSGVAPLSDTSTRFQFREARPGEPQVMRMFFKQQIAPKADAVGLWIRAHRPPGFVREFDAFNANPIARFYLGKLPYRQLIEIEYDRWHFISSPARLWTESSTDYPPALLFWPSEKEAFQPILEVNSFAAYRLSLEDGIDTPEKTLGFVRERKDGTLALLVVGLPDKSAFWSQRLDRYIDSGRMRHVEDAPRIVSAESPDDPPPEEVRHKLTWQEDARILETHIPRMPPPPTEWYRKRILEDFPLIGYRLDTKNLSAVLFNEVREKDGDKP